MRIGRIDYYCEMTLFVAGRATCLRRNIGAVVTIENRVVATGYNGPPAGHKHCTTCLKGDAPSGTALDRCPAIHAEANAILQAAYLGISIKGGTLYVSVKPCFECLKMIINAGLSKVLYIEEYTEKTTDLYTSILSSSGLTMTQATTKTTGVHHGTKKND